MKNLITIFRRELGVYFHSPIGYIFLIGFLLVSMGLFITPFFTFPMADMRSFFNLLPLILCIFIPAVTMRLWADERKENTFEMLMTFPMKSHEIVLGKYFSSLVFFLLALVGTLVLPIMMIVLGNPDLGRIASAYLGSLLLGGMLLAVGLFTSVLCKDQIVAFIFTLLINIAMYLMGNGFIQSYLDSMLPGSGSLLGVLLGFTEHYASFARGVIELTDILFFLSWIALFLFLNGFYLEIRNRPKARLTFSTGVILAVIVGVLVNWVLTDTSFGRLDMTEGRIYTVSPSTQNILKDLKVPVNLKLYITAKEKMPTELKNLEQDITDKLTEMRIASNGHLNFDVIYMQASNVIGKKPDPKTDKPDKEEALEKRMLDKGVKPFSVQALREDSMENMLVYSALGIAYKDKPEEIIPRIVPQNLNDLEYQVVNNVYKMTREKMPVVALVAPKESVKIAPQVRQLYQRMGRPLPQQEDPYMYLERVLNHEKYQVRRVDLTRESPLPEEFDTLVVVNPRELNDRQRFEISKALVEGKNVFLAVQKYNWEYRVSGRQVDITRQEEKPMIDQVLKPTGVEVSNQILMDVNHAPLTVTDASNPLAQILGGGVTLNLPIQIVLGQESMNPDLSITSRLSGMFYLWGSPLEIDSKKLEENGLKTSTLVTTSDQAWTVAPGSAMDQASFEPPSDGGKKIPVAVMVQGQFPNAYKDKKRPEWPKEAPMPGQPKPPEEEPFQGFKPAPGKMILIGGTQMFRKEFLQQSNLDFFLNSVDALSLGDDLIKIRTKKPINRIIAKPSDAARAFWKFAVFFLVNFIIAVIGLVVILKRKRDREAYTNAHCGV